MLQYRRSCLAYCTRLVGFAAAVGCLAPVADAQWTVVDLHPAGATDSQAYGVQGGHQVGYVRVGDNVHAALWSGASGSWVDLHVPGAIESVAFGLDADQQVGYVRIGDVDRAALWQGAAASWVDLAPPGAFESMAFAIADGQQVGDAGIPPWSTAHAALWSGTSSSWIDLSPPGATSMTSLARGIGDAQQAGYVQPNSGERASLWSGTSGSWLDLTPAEVDAARISAIDGTQQAGFTRVGEVTHACVWAGTPQSCVTLHPFGADQSIASVANAAYAGLQAGETLFGSVWRASLWGGTPDTWVDLSRFLPAQFEGSDSGANGVWQDGGAIYVVGYARIAGTGQFRAVMWVGQGCYPLLSFTTQPSSVDYVQGATASFSVQTSIPAESLRWRHNGVPMSDGPNVSGSGTATLTIISAQDSDQGFYDCVASGACNTVTSNPVALTCAPLLLGGPPSRLLLVPGVQVHIAVAPDAQYSYAWRRDTVVVTDEAGVYSGAASPTLTIISGDLSLAGSYDVVVSNACGAVTSPASEVRYGICSADFDDDGDIGTDADIEAFFRCLSGVCCSACSADFNGDGDVGTDGDIESFFRVLAGGPC